MVKKRGILLRIITGTVMLILVVVSALVQTEPAAAAGSGISKVSFDGKHQRHLCFARLLLTLALPACYIYACPVSMA